MVVKRKEPHPELGTGGLIDSSAYQNEQIINAGMEHKSMPANMKELMAPIETKHHHAGRTFKENRKKARA